MLRSSNQLKLDPADKVCQDVCVVDCFEIFECFIGHTVGVTAELSSKQNARNPLPKKNKGSYIFLCIRTLFSEKVQNASIHNIIKTTCVQI